MNSAVQIIPKPISCTRMKGSSYISIPTRLERADSPMGGKFKAHQALSCAICGVMYQLAGNTELFRAATASGGDLVEYFVDEADNIESGNGN